MEIRIKIDSRLRDTIAETEMPMDGEAKTTIAARCLTDAIEHLNIMEASGMLGRIDMECKDTKQPKRKIDGDEFVDWGIRLVGKNSGSPGLRDSNNDWIMSTTTEEMAEFFLHAPDLARKLIDFVNFGDLSNVPWHVIRNWRREAIALIDKIGLVCDVGFEDDTPSDTKSS